MVDLSTDNIKEKYYNKKEELEIIKKYQELIIYVYNLLKKYPQNETYILCEDTKNRLLEGLENLIYAKKVYLKQDKLKFLNEVDIKLAVLKVLVRVAKKNKYINSRNYNAWSYKITEISNMLNKWIKVCQR